MKRWVFFLLLLYLAFSVYGQDDGLYFVPDSGKRVDGNAMGGVHVGSDGTVYLYGTNGPDRYLYVSSDGLNFTPVDINAYPDYRALQLPDGRFLRFEVVPTDSQVVLKASYSQDGFTFEKDSTVLFVFPDNDEIHRNWLYATAFLDSLGGVHYIYLAGNEDNARSIYAPRWDSLAFGDYRSNIFQDSLLGTGYQYVDPRGLVLPDGRLRVITMNQHGPPYPPAARKGTLYTFTSNDNGNTWVQDEGYRLRYDSFTEFEVYSLNDPKLVRLPDGRYRIYVAAMIKEADDSMRYSILSATSAANPTAIASGSGPVPEGFVLYPNQPNPFNPGTTIGYSLPAAVDVELTIYDIQGRRIRRLVQGKQAAGKHRVYWDGTDDGGHPIASGMYVYQLKADGIRLTRKMILLK